MKIDLFIALTIIGGSVATSAMTFFMIMLSRPLKQPLNVVAILGAMLTGHVTNTCKYLVTRGSIGLGIVVHYGIGYIFCGTFAWIWLNQIIRPNIFAALICGIAAGLIGVTIWATYIALYRYPPIRNRKIWFGCIFIGHILLSLFFYFGYIMVV